MKRILFIDTETTGMLIKHLPLGDARQPRVIQFAAVLATEDGRLRRTATALIKPIGWNIPAEATAVHGICLDDCERFGIPLAGLFDVLDGFAADADEIVAHNLAYDESVIAGEYQRAGRTPWAAGVARYCTMQAATPICRIPGMRGYKWPRLSEAHQHLLGQTFEDAHDALSDTLACMRCYFALRKLETAASK